MDAALKNLIDAYIDGHRDDIVRDIAGLVAIPSVTGNAHECRRALDYVCRRATDFGFEVSMTEEGDVAVIDLAAAQRTDGRSRPGETAGILVHVDVVGVGDRSKWDTDPFKLALRDGFLQGRGVADDKGPAVLALYAMRAVSENVYNPPHHPAPPPRTRTAPLPRIRLVVGTSEESAWTDMAHYKSQFELPDYGFSPDGEFPIYNEENGYTDVLLSFPAPPDVERLAAGDGPNTIPSRAEIGLRSGRTLIYGGVSAHSSVPEQGENAIEKLCAAHPEHAFSRFVNDRAYAGMNPQAAPPDDAGAESPSAPTMLRLEPGDAAVRLNINIRQAPGVTRSDIELFFESKRAAYSFAFEITEYLEPMRVDPDSPFLRTMFDVYRAYGLPGDFERARGSSYAKAMPRCVSWGPVLPGDPDTAHRENERLRAETAFTAAKLYASFLASL
jgi:succinyl-diaminopimelate desuccinylase